MDDCDWASEISGFLDGVAIRNAEVGTRNAERKKNGSELGVRIIPICTDCGRRIPKARQEAVPGCTRCAKCQGKTEIRGQRSEVRRARTDRR